MIPLAVRHELWRRNETSWKLEEHQEEAFNGIVHSNVDIGYLDLTRRGGKSFTFATIADFFCRTVPGTYVKYGAAFQIDLRRFIRPAFNKLLEDCPADIKPRYIKSESSYVYPNGNTIELVGLDKDPDKMRGNQVTIMIFDEAGFVSHLQIVWEDVVIPATARREDQMGQPLKLLIGSTPPPSAKAHFSYKLREKAKAEGYYLKKTLDEIKSIPDSEKERLYREIGGRHCNKARREFNVEWITDSERALMPTFDEIKHVKLITLPALYNSALGGDCAAKRDLTVFHIVAYDHQRDKFLIVDELWFDRKTPAAVWKPQVLAMEEAQPIKPKLRVIDMSEERRLDLAAEGFACITPLKSPGSKDAMLQFIRDLFYQDKIEIDPKCQKLIDTLSSHLLNNQGTDFERNETTGHADAYDSMAYVIDYISKQSPFPHGYGLNPSTHHIPEKPKSNLLQLGHNFRK